MTLNEKAEAIKYLKSVVIKFQRYEFAAWLRDKEKEILSQLNLPIQQVTIAAPIYSYDDSITYTKYLHLLEIISDFEDKYNSGREKQYTLQVTSEVKEYLYKSCINVIREEKLDRLFGDES